MTTFIESVEHYCKGLDGVSPGICSICADCQSDYGYDNEEEFAQAIESEEAIDEGGFSRCWCDSCGSGLAGNRYAAHAWTDEARAKGYPVDELIHLSICEDCLFFHANGDIPENWE